ncbi:nucleotidyltransferase-like protein [Aeribacillus pallidus]|uniref:nucleotidyltransferase-like protein n=1 Tax=Aeribacillus pallidus TaxID=33936 RepID=UPI001DB991F2|nr:hypothetical protein [Bacillus sp. (in: firmicutes)]
MEDILRPIYQERASQSETLGVLMVEKRQKARPITDLFDIVLLTIVKDAEQPVFVKHYQYNHQKAALFVVTEQQINEWILLGSNRRLIDWLLNGKVLFDRNEYVSQLRTELREFPFQGRKLKMAIEFAKLIRRYMDGKTFYDNNHYLDAFNHVVHSLHHLARLEVIEQGFHPEVTVWNQVRQIGPEIFKLYDELVNSDEPLPKRLELLFLASEFLIHSRTKIGAAHLLDLLKQKEYWTINDLLTHEEVKNYAVDLPVLIEYLIDKHFVEVLQVETKGQGLYHRYYRVVE